MARLITTPVEGVSAIFNFLMDAEAAAVPDDVRQQLRALVDPLQVRSPVAASVDAAELIYARADELPPELLAIGADLGTMAATHGFHGMDVAGRGHGIAAELRKRPGVQPAVEAPTEPPAPSDRFRPVKPEPPKAEPKR